LIGKAENMYEGRGKEKKSNGGNRILVLDEDQELSLKFEQAADE